MKANDWLKTASATLTKAGIGTARLDALVLLEDAAGKDRAWLLAHPEFELTNQQTDILSNQLTKREQHIPLAYIRGKTEFYGRDFVVNEQVLEPRPETETMIDLLKQLPPETHKQVIDVGTGSGAIAITAKLEIPESTVMATDIDPACLAVAKKNAAKHQVALQLMQGNLLQPLTTSFHLPTTILANLPYVPDSHQLNQAAMNEPRLAIFGGTDGLDLYRNLFEQIDGLPHKPSFVLTESLPFQHETLAQIAQHQAYNLVTTEDFIQLFAPS
jgi:release factor glutamine methyltransferase